MQTLRPLDLRPNFQLFAPAWLVSSARLLGVLGLLSGCATPADAGGADASVNPDASAQHDAGADLGAARCELPYDQRAIDQVAAGLITVAAQPGDPTTFTAQIDATAGGSSNYGENPFIYIDLINGKKVAITDVQAEHSGDWDMAFKRWQIKLNGGSSGPGMVGAARVAGKDLADVTTAPAGPYATDNYFDAQCNVVLDDIDGLQTVLADWYDYEMGTMRLTPKKEVIVLNRRDQKGHIKVQLTTYYNGTVSANYGLTWSLLP